MTPVVPAGSVPVIGICEDDDALRQILRTALEQADYVVRATASGTEAVRAFSVDAPTVIVLDIGLADADGRDVCQALRARGIRSPVLFLTARDALSDKLSGFHAGGDNYLTKPFALSELKVRVGALARRGRGAEPPAGDPASAPAPARVPAPSRVPSAGAAALGMLLDPERHALAAAPATDGVPVRLTPTEYRLLATICAAGGTVVRRSGLICAGWPDGASVSDNTLDAYISKIRLKLRRAGRSERIENVRGVGYALQ